MVVVAVIGLAVFVAKTTTPAIVEYCQQRTPQELVSDFKEWQSEVDVALRDLARAS